MCHKRPAICYFVIPCACPSQCLQYCDIIIRGCIIEQSPKYALDDQSLLMCPDRYSVTPLVTAHYIGSQGQPLWLE
jgi:hypothetical protein